MGVPDELRADCGRCAGLCCTALPFARSSDFPVGKPAAVPCRHLAADHSCEIHDRLRAEGWRGCTVFECFGAGQQVVQVTYAGRTWADSPELAPEMVAAFEVMRLVHEVRWYAGDLVERHAEGLPADLLAEVTALGERAGRLAAAPAPELTPEAASSLQGQAGPLLVRASAALRAGAAARAGRARGRGGRRFSAYADLAGADLRGADLTGSDLRGSLLIGADLTGATLDRTDLLGADLRDCRLGAVDLTHTLYLTQAQVNAALGDAATALPPRLHPPRHWPA
ncbi:pentapeptide repeat-containing protein [Arsenicicoccus dermatophilus]|uniref:pentapeptide repeat-containing protein n=1 Tax=Arsenicicoccus dermatophilus TaxID=1076331 RepID=UPI003917267B